MTHLEPITAEVEPHDQATAQPLSTVSLVAGKSGIDPVNYVGAGLSVKAFEQDLSELLISAPGQWVAYAHGNRLRIMDNQPDLYRYCRKELGLRHDEFIVRLIIPAAGLDVESALR